MVRVLALLLVVATGCRDEDADRLAKVKDEVCACKSILCANTALKQIPAKRDVEPSYRAQHIAKLMMECLARLHAEGRPTPDPDAPSAEAKP